MAHSVFSQRLSVSARGITIHHLLSHTSGIREPYAMKEITAGEGLSTMEIIESVAKRDLLFVPGREWRYSNANYFLAGKILEKVTGQGLHDYQREHIMRPSGMNDTSFNGEQVDGLASPTVPVFRVTPAMSYAAGDLVSTAEDLYRYDRALYGESLAGRDAIERMLRPAHDGRFIKYGYGWFIKHLYGQRSVAHEGFDPNGYTAHLERYIDDGAAVIVISNKVQKHSPLGVKYFNSTDVARQLAARLYGRKARFWQRFF